MPRARVWGAKMVNAADGLEVGESELGEWLPGQLEQSIGEFVDYYNNHRYHESLDNLTPADVCFGRGPAILKRRHTIKPKTIAAGGAYARGHRGPAFRKPEALRHGGVSRWRELRLDA